jgi:predicted nucleic acid-binding protein
MVIIADTGPLLSFARAHRLELLRAVVGTLLMPEAVYTEIVVHGAGKPGVEEVRQASWIQRESVTDRAFLAQLSPTLHLGEREALALAKERGGIVLVDDQEARKEAHRLGLAYLGSLRILKDAKDRGLVNAVRPILAELITTGTYLSETLSQAFLRELGEG